MSLYQNGNSVSLTPRLRKDAIVTLLRTGIFKVNISKEESKELLGYIHEEPGFKPVNRYPIKKDGVKYYEYNFVSQERWKHLQASKG